jgi:hypothetical protein
VHVQSFLFVTVYNYLMMLLFTEMFNDLWQAYNWNLLYAVLIVHIIKNYLFDFCKGPNWERSILWNTAFEGIQDGC